MTVMSQLSLVCSSQMLTEPAIFARETSCDCRAPHEKLTIAQARRGTPGKSPPVLDKAERVTLALGCDVILNRNENQLSAAIYPKYPEPAGLMEN